MRTPMQPGPDGGPSDRTEHVELRAGQLSRRQLVSLALASGSPAAGVALVPMLMFSYSGVVSWPSQLLGMLATVCLGVCVSAFARRYVVSGSLYSYVSTLLGAWARYLTGAALIIGFVLQVAVISGVVGMMVGSFLTSVGVHGAAGGVFQAAIYLVVLAAVACIALLGLDASVRVIVTMAALSLPLPIIITVSSGLHTGLAIPLQFNVTQLSVAGTFQGVAAGVVWLVGFESCAALAAETRDARRNVPVAVLSLPIVLGILYLVATVVQLPGLAAVKSQVEQGISPIAALALHAGFPPVVAVATDLVLAAALFCGLIGFVNYGSRFVVTLAADGLLPSKLARVHERRGSPGLAIVALSFLGLIIMSAAVFAAGAVETAYNAIAVALVYAWLLPYLLLVVGTIVLVTQSHRRQMGLLTCAIVSGVVIIWIVVNDIVNPLPELAGMMRWIVLTIIAVLFLMYLAGARRTPKRKPPC
jgi:amino acid transporter